MLHFYGFGKENKYDMMTLEDVLKRPIGSYILHRERVAYISWIENFKEWTGIWDDEEFDGKKKKAPTKRMATITAVCIRYMDSGEPVTVRSMFPWPDLIECEEFSL